MDFDMDCSPLSPILPDVEIDILTDTTPTPPSYHHTHWIQWNTIQQCVSVPPFHDMSVWPPVLVWQTLGQKQPPATTWHSSAFAAPTTLYAPSFDTGAHTQRDIARSDSFASVASLKTPVDSKPHTFHLYSFGATRDRIQDTAEVCWQEPPHSAGTPHSTSVATLADEFERSLTLVTPSSGTDPIGPIPRRATPVRIPPGHLVDSPPSHCGSLGENRDANTPSPPFERESTASLEQGKGQPPETEPLEQNQGRSICFLDIADKSRPLFDTASLLAHTFPKPPASPRAAPHVCPRPPTPPPSRYSKSTRRNTDTTCPRVLTSEIDLAELPAAQASVQAGKGNQLQPDLSDFLAVAPAPRCVPGDGLEVCGSGSSCAVPSSPGTALNLGLPFPSTGRCRPRRRKVEEAEREEGQGRPECRARVKQTRFIVPDPEDEGEEKYGATPGRSRASDVTRRTSGFGPLRSILRNKPAPYDKAMMRHARRRASVP